MRPAVVADGVPFAHAPVRLEFRDLGGATTGKLLPTGNAIDTLDVPGYGKFKASLVDAALLAPQEEAEAMIRAKLSAELDRAAEEAGFSFSAGDRAFLAERDRHASLRQTERGAGADDAAADDDHVRLRRKLCCG